MDWRAVVCNHVPEVPGTVRSGAWQDSGLVDAGGKGSYRVGGVFLSAERHRAGGGIRRCCLNSSGGEVEAYLRRGSRWRSGVAQPAGRGVRGAKGFSSLRLLGTVIALRYFFNCPLKSVIDIQMEGFRER